MNNRYLLQGMNGWSQFFFFLFLAFTGLILTSLVMLTCIDVANMSNSAREMRMAQTISQVGIFLFPSIAFAFLCQGNIKNYLMTKDQVKPLTLILSLLLIIAIQPTIDFIGYLNQQISLPDSLASLEAKIRAGEESAQRVVALLFTDKSVLGLVTNLLVIAVVAGLVEELFFRGCLQQIIKKISKNSHAAVWITAIIFSAIHFQFLGFIPRIILGAVLGYLFEWTRNLWVPIIVHTINNAISVIFAYLFFDTPQYEELTSFSLEKEIWYIIPSVVISIILLFLLYKYRQQNNDANQVPSK